jgi:hypothetical protein
MKTNATSIRLTAAEREFFLWATLTQPRFRFPVKRKRSVKLVLPTEAEIQRTAHRFWIEAGRSQKHPREPGSAAKERLSHEGARNGGTPRCAPEIAAHAVA